MKITDLKNYKVVGTQTQTFTVDTKEEGVGGVKGFGVGLLKSGAGTLRGMGVIGQDIAQATAGRVVEAITGTPREDLGTDIYDPESKKGAELAEELRRKGGAEKFGGFVGDVAQFAIPGTMATKATAGSGLLARAGAQALTAGTVTSAQEGEVGKDALISAGTAGAFTLATPVVASMWRKATTDLPEWIVKPLVKQAKAQKVAGKANAEKTLLESGRVGSVDKILKKTNAVIGQLDDQVDDMIAKATEGGKTINTSTIKQSVVDKVNLAGGEIDDVGVQEIMERLAPQAKGLLKKEVLTVKEANQLRKAIDKTLGDRAFFSSQLPYNKDIAMDFVGTLRESVKSNLPETARKSYVEMSKNIELRKALLSRAMESGGPNRIGMMDLLTGLGVGATVNPLAGIGVAVGRRALESGVAKTGVAQGLMQLGKAGPILAGLQPTEQAIVLAFLKKVAEENEQESQTQQAQASQ